MVSLVIQARISGHSRMVMVMGAGVNRENGASNPKEGMGWGRDGKGRGIDGENKETSAGKVGCQYGPVIR